MKVDLFDFSLPNELIALRPITNRDRARFLVVKGAALSDEMVTDLTHHLREGDLMIFNDTRVIPARLKGIREANRGNAKVEITLHMNMDHGLWKAFVKPAKKLKEGDKINFSDRLFAKVEAKGEMGEVTLQFDRTAEELTKALHDVGVMPLPPYIAAQRPVDDQDLEDYQTVYSKHDGAVAAPTAGLHFTHELEKLIDDKKIGRAFVTLHVGAGTFLPVKVDETDDHKMHSEWGEISREVADQINKTRSAGGRIIAVGTTSLRLLESAADDEGIIHPFCKATDIFITPGYKFKAVDILMTNFHLPKSTLFMLVSAFAGYKNMLSAYRHAIKNNYRFYSYGDSSLLFRQDQIEDCQK